MRQKFAVTAALALLAAMAGAGAGAWPTSARAFCRTSTCMNCPRDEATGCTIGGTPLAWPGACVSFSLNEQATADVDLDTATALMAEAFATWEAARCGDADDDSTPSIHLSHAFGPAECSQPQYNPSVGNANLIVFRENSWPYTSELNQLATTSITFGADGTIHDADMEINATNPLVLPMSSDTAELHAFTVHPHERAFGIIPGQFDLLSIMIHEAGHFLGLDHSREENAIMLADLGASQVRTQLTDDDIAAICTAYPPDRDADSCDPEPNGGFMSECQPLADSGGCSSLRQGGKSDASTLGQLALLLGAISLLRARRLRRWRTR